MTTQLPISSLIEGHAIDLEPIADYLHSPDGDQGDYENLLISIQYEYAYVEGGELETDECYRIDTAHGCFGLPPDLLVTVVSFTNPETGEVTEY